MAEKNVHANHRIRMKRRFLDEGSLDGFEMHEKLEMLLYYAYPRQDTNGIAHKLLDHFGSFSALCDAPVHNLMEYGLTENVAVLLKMIPEFSRIYINDKHYNTDKVIDLEHLGEYFVPKFIGKDTEEVYLLLMDSKCKELFCGIVSKGSFTSSDVPVKRIVELTMKYNAYTAVLAHNHPSGSAIPSRADLKITKKLISTLQLVDSQLIDHIIVADNDYISLAQSELTGSIFYSQDD
jgi:DNA repair protein RadC